MSNSIEVNPRFATACLECGQARIGTPKKTFLGFQKLECSACRHQSLYPLSKGYVVIYWVAIVLITAMSIRFLMNGAIPIPGVLFFAGIYGLWRDRQIYQNIVENPPPPLELPDHLDDSD